MDKETSSEVKINEHALIDILSYAYGYMKKLEENKDHLLFPVLYSDIGDLIRNCIFNINHQFGFEKYYYDKATGIKNVELEKKHRVGLLNRNWIFPNPQNKEN